MTEVLLVDDEPTVGKRIKPLLEEHGYRVEFHADPSAAIDCLRERAFDVVVTDMRMGPVNGLQVLAAAQERPSPPQVIIITGYATMEMAREAMVKGAHSVIAKPFKPADLRKAIDKACKDLKAARRSEPAGSAPPVDDATVGAVDVAEEPAVGSGERSSADASRVEGEEGMGIDILVLDDEPIVGKRLKVILADRGYRVETFTEPAQAVARAMERRFDIIVTDVVMPGMNGIEVLQKVVERWSGIKVILITGYATMAMAREAMGEGAFDFVSKPFKAELLTEVVGNAADKLLAEREPSDR